MNNDRLKFRAWDERGHFYYPGDEYGTRHSFDVFKYFLEGQPVHIMQWTGLEDRNQTPIYEGDFVKSGMTGALYLVCWSDEYSGWYKQMIYSNIADRPIYQDSSSDYIVGNIYENPELLEG